MYAFWFKDDPKEIYFADTLAQAHGQVADMVHDNAYHEAGTWLTYYTVQAKHPCDLVHPAPYGGAVYQAMLDAFNRELLTKNAFKLTATQFEQLGQMVMDFIRDNAEVAWQVKEADAEEHDFQVGKP